MNEAVNVCVCPLDGWVSLHIDELIAAAEFPGGILELQCMPVSDIFRKSSFSATGSVDITSQTTF